MTAQTYVFGQLVDNTNLPVKWSPFQLMDLQFTPDPIAPPDNGLKAVAFNLSYGGEPGFERSRGANVFHNVVKRTGAESAVWTPAADLKFILMGVAISVAGTLAVAGPVFVSLLDGSGGTVFYEGLAAVSDTLTGDTQMGVDYGQGRKSAVVNTVLFATFTDDGGTPVDFVTGGATINVWGIEDTV